MYNSLAGAPTSVNEQLAKQKTRCSAWPRIPDEAHDLHLVFWFVRS